MPAGVKNAVTQMNDCLRVSKVSWKFRISASNNVVVICREISYFLKKYSMFYNFFCLFCFQTILRRNSLKTRALLMRKYECLLFVFKQSYICYNLICMTIPLTCINKLKYLVEFYPLATISFDC